MEIDWSGIESKWRAKWNDGKDFETIEPEALELLEKHPWPGNVRELANVMRRVVVTKNGQVLERGMLPDELGQASVPYEQEGATEPQSIDQPKPSQIPGKTSQSTIVTLAELEKEDRIILKPWLKQKGKELIKNDSTKFSI